MLVPERGMLYSHAKVSSRMRNSTYVKNEVSIMVRSEEVADSECGEEPIRLRACFFFCIGREETILMNFSSKLRAPQPRNPCAVANTFFIGHTD